MVARGRALALSRSLYNNRVSTSWNHPGSTQLVWATAMWPARACRALLEERGHSARNCALPNFIGMPVFRWVLHCGVGFGVSLGPRAQGFLISLLVELGSVSLNRLLQTQVLHCKCVCVCAWVCECVCSVCVCVCVNIGVKAGHFAPRG